MPTESKKLRPPIKRHGGKFYLAPKLIPHFPPHSLFIEPFVGGGSVILNKSPAWQNIASDLDPGLINMWVNIRDNVDSLVRILSGLLYQEETFEAWKDRDETSGMLGAAAYIIKRRFSRGGLGKSFAWSERKRGGRPGDENSWLTFLVELPKIAERIREIRFICGSAVEVISTYQDSQALVYADPPYLKMTRTAKEAYGLYETTDADHLELIRILCKCRCMVALSGYRNDAYDTALRSWKRIDIEMPNHSGQGKSKQRRVECLWIKA